MREKYKIFGYGQFIDNNGNLKTILVTPEVDVNLFILNVTYYLLPSQNI